VVSVAAEDLRTRLLAGCPVQERRLELAGASSAVLEAGSGPPLLLLHGGIECGGVYWAKVIAPLAEHHRVVVPDVPGLGESAPFSRMDLAHFGAWFDGMPFGLLLAAIRFGLRPSARNLERFAHWAFVPPEASRRTDREWFEALLAYDLACGKLAHVQRSMRQLVRIGKRRIPEAELRRIATPTALLWGRDDRMVPLRVGEDARSRLGWPLHVVDDLGHVPHVDRPERFLRALRDAFGAAA
jgi:pimeloyl-ACP methyl ester carboxylesterase